MPKKEVNVKQVVEKIYAPQLRWAETRNFEHMAMSKWSSKSNKIFGFEIFTSDIKESYTFLDRRADTRKGMK